jgi:hypothetical protein
MHEHAAQPEPRARRRGRAGVVGLRRAERHHRGRSLLERRAERELELAHLVAGQAERADVVALEPHLDAELVGEAGRGLERRRQRGERDARQGGERIGGHRAEDNRIRRARGVAGGRGRRARARVPDR